jgi:hypothetical protein
LAQGKSAGQALVEVYSTRPRFISAGQRSTGLFRFHGVSHKNADKTSDPEKPTADSGHKRRSAESGGGGENDSHHTHDDGQV